MPRPGTTAQRGYGSPHAARARELKAAMVDGQRCARGGERMYRHQLALPRSHPRSIEADHVSTPRALGHHLAENLPDALSCAHHNRQHGARLGNHLRGAARGARHRGRRTRGSTTGQQVPGQHRAQPATLPAW